MSSPQMRLLPLLCVLSFAICYVSLGQTPTATPRDSDEDGVPDRGDGWPLHPQLTSAPVPNSHYVTIRLGRGIGYAINNLGDVVGEAYNQHGESEAILWRLGQPATFLGFLTPGRHLDRWSIAWGINDARQITGRSTYGWNQNVPGQYPEPPSNPVWDATSSVHAFLWQNGAMVDLRDLSVNQPRNLNFPDPRNKLDSEGRAINGAGVVVGYSHTNAATESTGWAWHIVHDSLHAARLDGTAPVDLGIPTADAISDAMAINDNGAIVGAGGNYQYAFFQSDGQTQIQALVPGVNYASGLNNFDHVVGTSDNTSAFLWVPTSNLPENQRTINLANLTTFPYTGAAAINDADQIVGYGSEGALLWRNGKAYKLDDLIARRPNFSLLSATAINQSGMIVANTAGDSEGEVFLLIPNELMVDANNDGKMSFTNAAVHNKDKTKRHAPYQFWVNDDRDEGDNDVPVEGLVDWTKDVIDQKRDLEDFTRLWISFKGLTDFVKSPGIQLKLEWQPNDGRATWDAVDGNPAIKLFPAAEADGGRKYLDRNNSAETQSSPPYNTTYGLVRRDFPLVLPLGPEMLARLTEAQPNLYFLFEGVARGKGRLVLKLLLNGVSVAEYPPLYMEIKDVKDMYERWTVGDVTQANTSILSSLDYQVWPAVTPEPQYGMSQMAMPDPTTEEEKDYVLMVHGWNTSPFDKNATGDTTFKRLHWQGFNGRFGLFRWPTFYFEGSVPPVHHFDASEHRAWASSLGLLTLINRFNAGPFAGKVRIIAHSMGNVVASEALRRSESGQIVHTYVASQAAISAHCYDANTPAMTFRRGNGPTTPDVYAYYWQEGAMSQPHQWQSEDRPSYMSSMYLLGKAGRYFNYYNDEDAALNWPLWQLDQQIKPDAFYGYRSGGVFNRGFFRDPGYGATWLTFPIDRYEVFAWAAESRSYALGAQYVNGVILASQSTNVDLKRPPFNYGSSRKFHSAQFADTNAQRKDYWEQLLSSCGLLE